MQFFDAELKEKLADKLSEVFDDLKDPEIMAKLLEMSEKDHETSENLCKFNRMVTEIVNAACDNLPLSAYVFFLTTTRASIENVLSRISKRNPELVDMVDTMVEHLKAFGHPKDCATCPKLCADREDCEDGKKGADGVTRIRLFLRKCERRFWALLLPKVLVFARGYGHKVPFHDCCSIRWKLTVARGKGGACYVRLNAGEDKFLANGESQEFNFCVDVYYGGLKRNLTRVPSQGETVLGMSHEAVDWWTPKSGTILTFDDEDPETKKET